MTISAEERIATIDQAVVVIDRTIDEIERELGHRLDVHQRVAVTFALERLEANARQRACLECQWCPY